MQQGTDEWLNARLGRVTASRISDVMMKPATAGYQNYRAQLVCERLTKQPTDFLVTAAMQHGTDTEPQARAVYTMMTGNSVEEVGFIPHPTLEMAGASPDGRVLDIGLVEIKCPQPAEHIRMLTGGNIKRQYFLQMQWQMACTGCGWCDFVSFSTALPDEMQMHITRVDADHGLIEEITESVAKFLLEVDTLQADLQRKYVVAA
ncbi:MAG: YqaJ viral recombinase family protein [Altererythrobacter ishigakiensis]|nr:YqaJ viral recombinase family protein [Altererythrobacter ishigakiensis]